jgi:hypothetical protein
MSLGLPRWQYGVPSDFSVHWPLLTECRVSLFLVVGPLAGPLCFTDGRAALAAKRQIPDVRLAGAIGSRRPIGAFHRIPHRAEHEIQDRTVHLAISRSDTFWRKYIRLILANISIVITSDFLLKQLCNAFIYVGQNSMKTIVMHHLSCSGCMYVPPSI